VDVPSGLFSSIGGMNANVAYFSGFQVQYINSKLAKFGLDLVILKIHKLDRLEQFVPLALIEVILTILILLQLNYFKLKYLNLELSCHIVKF
jgi:hypothetical protein